MSKKNVNDKLKTETGVKHHSKRKQMSYTTRKLGLKDCATLHREGFKVKTERNIQKYLKHTYHRKRHFFHILISKSNNIKR